MNMLIRLLLLIAVAFAAPASAAEVLRRCRGAGPRQSLVLVEIRTMTGAV